MSDRWMEECGRRDIEVKQLQARLDAVLVDIECHKSGLEFIDDHLFRNVNTQATRDFITEDNEHTKRILKICDMRDELDAVDEAAWDKLKEELDDSRGCIADTVILMADYDGYTDAVGLKKLIDQAVELLKSAKPEEFHTEKEWNTINAQAAEIRRLKEKVNSFVRCEICEKCPTHKLLKTEGR